MKHRLSQHRSLGCSSTACNKVHRLYSSLAVRSFSVLTILASCGENPGTGDQGSGSQTGGDSNSGGTTTTGGTTTGNEGNFSGENSGTGGSTTASSSSGGVAGNSVGTGGRGGSGGLGGTTKGTTGTGGSSSSSGCPALTNARRTRSRVEATSPRSSRTTQPALTYATHSPEQKLDCVSIRLFGRLH